MFGLANPEIRQRRGKTTCSICQIYAYMFMKLNIGYIVQSGKTSADTAAGNKVQKLISDNTFCKTWFWVYAMTGYRKIDILHR